MKTGNLVWAVLPLALTLAASAQGPGPGPGTGPEQGHKPNYVYRQEMHDGGPDMMMHGPGPMKWWKDSETIKQLGLSDAQAQKIEHTYYDHKMKLIDIMADLEKQELKMDSLMNDDHPDDAQVISQIDQVVQARGGLEKENARMMLDMRRILTTEQWHKLQSIEPGMGFGRRIFIRKMGPGGPGGMNGPMLEMHGPMPPPPDGE